MERWDEPAFQRVFLSLDDALMWSQRHQRLGPPSQPFHYEPLVQRCRGRAEERIEGEADFLGAVKALVLAAVAQGESSTAAELGRCATSHSPL